MLTPAILLQVQANLEAELKEAGLTFRAVPGVGSGYDGLTPDAIKASAGYAAAKHAYDRAFDTLRRFNGTHMKALLAARQATRRTAVAA